MLKYVYNVGGRLEADLPKIDPNFDLICMKQQISFAEMGNLYVRDINVQNA